MRWLRRVASAALIVALPLAGTAGARPLLRAQQVRKTQPNVRQATQPLRVRETLLGERSTNLIPGTLTFSSALDVAYITKTARGEQVVVNAVPGKVFVSIPRVRLTEAGPVNSITFSANGERFAYVAITNNKSVMVVDGAAGAPFDYIAVGSAYFSADSRHVTYIGKRGDKTFMVWDGHESAPYDQISVRHASFTADFKHIVYTASRGGQHFMVMDNREVGSAEYVGDPTLAKTGSRMAYVIMRNNEWSVVLDGKEGKRFQSIGNNLVFSDDAQHFLYRARGDFDHVVHDGIESADFGSIRENSYGLSRDGKHVAFVSTTGRRDAWVLDGVSQKTYDWVSGNPTFSPDGQKLAYATELDRKRFVVIGAREGEPFDDISEFPQFSPDGRVLYLATRGNQHFVVVDTVATAYDAVSNAFISASGQVVTIAKRGSQWGVFADAQQIAAYDEVPHSVRNSPDGKLLVYIGTRNGKELVWANGKESALYDDIQFVTISPDGKHVAFVAARGEKRLVILDGVESAEYDEVLWLEGPRPSDSRGFGFLARRGRTDIRGTVAWNAAS